MIRILLVVLITTLAGWGLALGTGELPVRVGALGLAAMVLAALAARNYWLGLRLAAPGSPERSLWLALASTSLIAGHFFASLYRLGAQMDLHGRAGHAFGIDNWTLVLGGILAYQIAKDPEPRKDERDAWVAGRGLYTAYCTLVGLLLGVSVLLVFGVGRRVPTPNLALVAHWLIGAVMVSCLASYIAQLLIYWQDHQAAREDEAAP